MQNYNNNDYISLFNENNTIIPFIEGWSEFYLNNEILTILKILYSKININQPLMLVCSDSLNNTILWKITNDYIIDNSINGNKLINL